jgi:hypothetical protein
MSQILVGSSKSMSLNNSVLAELPVWQAFSGKID